MNLKQIFSRKKQIPLKPVYAVLTGFIVLYTVAQTLIGNGMVVLEAFAWWGVLTGTTSVLFALPVYLALRKARLKPAAVRQSVGLLGLAALVYLGYILILTAPRIGWFAELDFNWQGKILAILAAVLLIVFWKGLSWRMVGLNSVKPGTWWRVFAVIAGVCVFWFVMGSSAEAPTWTLTSEAVLFQAFMPSIEEELIWRGILWALIAMALPETKRFWRVGWSLAITTVLFGLGHSLTIQSGFMLNFDVALLIFTGLSGYLLGWIRARSGSIIPAIVLHSGINLAALLIPALVYGL